MLLGNVPLYVARLWSFSNFHSNQNILRRFWQNRFLLSFSLSVTHTRNWPARLYLHLNSIATRFTVSKTDAAPWPEEWICECMCCDVLDPVEKVGLGQTPLPLRHRGVKNDRIFFPQRPIQFSDHTHTSRNFDWAVCFNTILVSLSFSGPGLNIIESPGPR